MYSYFAHGVVMRQPSARGAAYRRGAGWQDDYGHGYQQGGGGARASSSRYAPLHVERDDAAEFEASPLKRQIDDLEVFLSRAVEAIKALPRLYTSS